VRFQRDRRLFLQHCNSQAGMSPKCHRFLERTFGRRIFGDGWGGI
jgi:hypothetical protein